VRRAHATRAEGEAAALAVAIRRSVAVAMLTLLGCSPGLGPFVLPSVEGRVTDRDDRAPIAGAEIVQFHRGAGTLGAEPDVLHARWTRTDGQGRFAFAAELVPSARMWLLETYGPRYDFYHPDYGLVRGPTTDAAHVTLEGSLDQAEQRRMDLQVFCASADDDPGSRHLREVACPARLAR
jgi:hypothetical protein